jgi:hypothetical protein
MELSQRQGCLNSLSFFPAGRKRLVERDTPAVLVLGRRVKLTTPPPSPYQNNVKPTLASPPLLLLLLFFLF